MNREVTVWAPATVANLNVGFDSLGCALTNPGEKMVVRMTDDVGVVRIKSIHGAELDVHSDRNIASVAAKSLLQALGNPCGLELELFKDIKPGSGIGSSAASAAGAVVAVNALLNADLRQDELLTFALDGEQIASGARHADNVAPALLGGLVLCPPEGKPIALPVPNNWHIVVLHPQIEVKTADSRGVLPLSVSLEAAAKQASWMGMFVAACYRDDSEQAALALEDLLIAPHRKKLIPYFQHIEKIAIESGARAGGISGSGPSTFWLATSEVDALAVVRALKAFMIQNDAPFQLHRAQIAQRGAHIIA